MPGWNIKNKKRYQANYNRITETFKNGDIIRDDDGRACVVIEITEHDIRNKNVSVLFPGKYALYGFWYGCNALDCKAYGKIQYIRETDIVIGTFYDYKYTQLTAQHWFDITEDLLNKQED